MGKNSASSFATVAAVPIVAVATTVEMAMDLVFACGCGGGETVRKVAEDDRSEDPVDPGRAAENAALNVSCKGLDHGGCSGVSCSPHAGVVALPLGGP